jgi:hypothetical protein
VDIVTAMTEINTRLGALAITSPIPESVRKVWDPIPPDAVGLPEAPCFMNSLTFSGMERTASQLIEHYVLHMQFFVKDADRDRGLLIARAFHVALIAAFGPHPTLTGKVTDQSIRGGTPSETSLERAGVSYPGLDEYMDITIKNGMSFDAA